MNLINEASPHFHGKGSTQWIMGMVCLSLVPTLVASVFLYGLGAPLLVLVCVATELVTAVSYTQQTLPTIYSV